MAAEAIARAVLRLDQLGKVSDDPACLTRTFLSAAMRETNALVGGWMREAGLRVHEDAGGNLIGRLVAEDPQAPVLICGSHLDTVRDAGRFDGALGVLTGLAAIEAFQAKGNRPKFHLDLVGFCDEEGVRFQTTYLGSCQYTGGHSEENLRREDENGISLADALDQFEPRDLHPGYKGETKFLGYVEAHIEQGPVLHELDLAVGCVESICGQTRARVEFRGRSQHAGTTPMNLRADAMAAAAEFVLLVEKSAGAEEGVVATVGQLEIDNAASNTVPGLVNCSLDLRSADESLCQRVLQEIRDGLAEISSARGVTTALEIVQDEDGVTCSPTMSEMMASAIENAQGTVPRMQSGAGHDAVMMSHAMEVAMLFVRCRDGLSHHPDEYASPEDIGVCIDVLTEFFERLNNDN